MNSSTAPLNPKGLIRRIPLRAHELVQPITPQDHMFVLAHIGIPKVDLLSWQLEVCGAVESPRRISFEELQQLPRRRVESFHQCAGFPRRPDLPTRRVVNVVWTGVRVRDVLATVGVRPHAGYLWAYGLDRGNFEGQTETYVKDLPLADLSEGDWLLAYEVNGEPLTAEHGFPVRLVVPGYYGTNSVKWLHRLELADHRASGPFTTTLYNDPVGDPANGKTRPVWKAPPECLIVSPAAGAHVRVEPVPVWGWTWGRRAIAKVEVSTDGGLTWSAAALEPRRQWAWQRFTFLWHASASGPCRLFARATDIDGDTQPMYEARNAIHSVDVDVVPA